MCRVHLCADFRRGRGEVGRGSLRQSVVAPSLPCRPHVGPVSTRTSPPSAPFHILLRLSGSSFLYALPHLCLTVDFLRGYKMWGERSRPFVRGWRGRLLGALFVSRVACSVHEGVTQTFRCSAGSCHDVMLPTGRLVTVSLSLECSALMFLCFSFFFFFFSLGLAS